ncbi:MAG: hypothetical protein OCD01_18515 [Fibrobacterales bacterium]
MKTLLIKIAVASLVCTAMTFAGETIIIVNKNNPITSISKSNLKRLYVGKRKDLGDFKAVPVNQDLNKEITEKFLTTYIGKTGAEFKVFWIDQMIKGKGTAPMIQKSAEAVMAIVKEVPGAIGYIDEADFNGTVKKIIVN